MRAERARLAKRCKGPPGTTGNLHGNRSHLVVEHRGSHAGQRRRSRLESMVEILIQTSVRGRTAQREARTCVARPARSQSSKSIKQDRTEKGRSGENNGCKAGSNHDQPNVNSHNRTLDKSSRKRTCIHGQSVATFPDCERNGHPKLGPNTE